MGREWVGRARSDRVRPLHATPDNTASSAWSGILRGRLSNSAALSRCAHVPDRNAETTTWSSNTGLHDDDMLRPAVRSMCPGIGPEADTGGRGGKKYPPRSVRSEEAALRQNAAIRFIFFLLIFLVFLPFLQPLPTELSALEVLWSLRASRWCTLALRFCAKSDVLPRNLGPGKSNPIRVICWMKAASSPWGDGKNAGAGILRQDRHVNKSPSLPSGMKTVTSRLQQTIDPYYKFIISLPHGSAQQIGWGSATTACPGTVCEVTPRRKQATVVLPTLHEKFS
ncbi:hypothetical protein H4582DRAFT_358126 [Lactarius indigo]|nr:hypothetical protein H4582DRAFT_358126 [Lactarius indigo]